MLGKCNTIDEYVVQFPYEKELPFAIIKKMVKFSADNLKRIMADKKKRV